MSEVVILDEMVVAGIQALTECRRRRLGSAEIAVAVFLAMRAVEELAYMRQPESVH